MSARTSPEMLKARELIERGANRYQASQATGVHVTSITRSKWYRDFITENPPHVDEATPMQRARILVESGKTAYEASKLTGVAQSSISRATWYKSYKAKRCGQR